MNTENKKMIEVLNNKTNIIDDMKNKIKNNYKTIIKFNG